MTTHASVFARLDDYVGGELSEGERRAVRAHLEGCGECRAEEAWLRSLLDQARFLPREVAPARELWSGVAARLEPRDEKVIPLRPRSLQLPRWMLAAAAAVVLVVASSAITARVVGTAGRGPVAVLPSNTARPAAVEGSALAAFRPGEVEYEKAIAELTAVLQTQRDRLAPETVATLEANLRIIDEAIRQSKAALRADPNSRELTQMLADVYDTKVEMLQRAVQL
ncbi:MAG TPA: zf-HC2 domain-containing protein [Longimicrobiaceae bacterium]|nr:zf-HC2 domain-containing protein [Longimicrobiaceae bacterium]